MPCLEYEDLRSFVEKGYVVVPQVVSAEVVYQAREAIAARVKQNPPAPNHRGPHFYFITSDLPRRLVAPLYDSARSPWRNR